MRISIKKIKKRIQNTETTKTIITYMKQAAAPPTPSNAREEDLSGKQRMEPTKDFHS